MPPLDTSAIVLATVRYGDTSKVARLATQSHGVVSAIAKGALRPKSRFGTALHLLAEGHASILLSRHGDLHTLIGFDPTKVRVGLAERVDRYAVASFLSELMLRFAPQEAHQASYDFFRDALNLLEVAPAEAVEVLGLRMAWGLVDRLGFAPSLDRCARDGRPIDPGETVRFSLAEGGVLCAACSRTIESKPMLPEDRRDLMSFTRGDADLPLLDDRHLEAHQRLLERYIRHHLSEGARLPALTFWAERHRREKEVS